MPNPTLMDRFVVHIFWLVPLALGLVVLTAIASYLSLPPDSCDRACWFDHNPGLCRVTCEELRR